MTVATKIPEAAQSAFESWLAALRNGDGAAVAAGLAEGVVFETPADASDAIIPYVGLAKGKPAVLAAFAKRATTVETLHSDIVASGVAGSHGFAEIHTRERALADGAEFAIASLHLFTFDPAGRIVRWQSFFDPDPEAVALKRRVPGRLIAAAINGDATSASAALAFGASPDAIDPDSRLPVLMLAAGRGDEAMTALLLGSGANVHLADAGAGATALHKAAQAGSLPVLRRLIEAGGFVDTVAASTGHTPLMEAIWFGGVELVRYLLDAGASLAVRASYGFSIVEHFEYEAKLNKSETFLAMKALIDAQRARIAAAVERQTLMAAVVAKDVEAAKRALAAGAEVNERAPITGGFNNGHTPLHVAARDGADEIVTLLIAAGADVNAVEPTFRAVPLHKAVYNGHAGITAQLVAARGIDIDVQGATNGYSPLHDSIWHGFADCADILIDAGARLDRRGHDGRTPLDLARRVWGDDHPTTIRIAARLAEPR